MISQSWKPKVRMLMAWAAMLASAYAFRPGRYYGELWQGAVWMVIGGVLVIAALRSERRAAPGAPDAAKASTPLSPQAARLHWVIGGAGSALLALLAYVNGAASSILSTDAQFALLVAGVVLVTLGFGAVRLKPQRWELDWTAALIVTGVTLAALAIRLWHINVSIRFLVDELAFTTGIRNLWARDTVEILMPMEGIAAFPYLFAYWQSKMVALLGRNFAGLRAASAVIGALTVPALYVLGRALLNRRAALIAAALLVTFPPHLHFSRLGLTEIASCLFGTLALAFLMRGVAHNRRLDYAAGGALLGLTHYFHESGRLLFTPLALVSVILLVLYRKQVNQQRKNLIVAGLTTLIVAAPIYYTLMVANLPLTSRLNTANVALGPDYWRDLLASGDWAWHFRTRIAEPFLMFVHQPERALFYMGYAPMLLEFLVPPFLIGLFAALWNWRQFGALLLLWLLAVLAGNSLLASSTTMPRYVIVFPAAMLLVAVGLDTLLSLISHRWIRRTATAVLLLAFSVAQTQYYFGWHIPLYNAQFRANWGHRDAQDAVLRSVDFPPGTQLHIISRKPPDTVITHGLLLFLRDDLELDLLLPDEVTPIHLRGLRPDADQAFFIEPNEPALLERLRKYADAGELKLSPFDLPMKDQFVLYYVERQRHAG